MKVACDSITRAIASWSAEDRDEVFDEEGFKLHFSMRYLLIMVSKRRLYTELFR